VQVELGGMAIAAEAVVAAEVKVRVVAKGLAREEGLETVTAS